MLTRKRDESGATAILVAMLAMALFGMAAIAVDLGNALSRKGDTQVTADFGALGAGTELPAPGTVEAAGDAPVQKVAEYFVENATADDDTSAPPSVSTMASLLVNNDDSDGEVYYVDQYTLRVVSPLSYVAFGFAGIFGLDGGDVDNGVQVASEATVMMGSPKGTGVLPMYVANPSPGHPGCDYGLQTLTDPPGGHTEPPNVPTLAFDGDNNNNTLDGMSVFEGGLPVGSISLNSTTASIILEGDFRDATKVGFFRSDDPTAAVVEVARASWDAPPGTTPYTQNNGAITVDVPPAVTGVDDLWYVRVYQNAGPAAWSDKDEARALSVGDAPFECVGGSEDGNFGTLKMPRSTSDTSTAEGWISRNVALGLETPLSLTLMPGAPPPWECNASTPGAVLSTSRTDRKPRTNCLDTDTGMTFQTATPGFITGGSDYEGLLDTGSSSDDPDGSGGCSPAGTTAPNVILGRSLNNDLLTCFFMDTTTTIGDVARRNYAGGPTFSSAIYDSPRFAWVPVFKQETESGGSGYYSIVDFRPAFIADQPMTATKGNSATGSSTDNGLGMNGNKLETLKVIFLHVNALPDGDASTPIGPYLGVGPKIVALID